MIVGLPRETATGERRVALTPADVENLAAQGLSAVVETGAGHHADFTDAAYRNAGARIVPDAPAVYTAADVIAWVKPPAYELNSMPLRPGQVLYGFQDPVYRADRIARLHERGVESIAFELFPTGSVSASADLCRERASVADDLPCIGLQLGKPRVRSALHVGLSNGGVGAGWDPLSAMSRIAGEVAYGEGRALLAAQVRAGRVRPLVLGCGQAGRAAVAAAVAAGDEPPVVIGNRAEQEAVARALGAGGFLVNPGPAALAETIADIAPDLVVCAAGRGRRAPVLLDAAGLGALAAGAVVVDLTAKAGGNTVATVANATVAWGHGVVVTHRSNYPAARPRAASLAYGAATAAVILRSLSVSVE